MITRRNLFGLLAAPAIVRASSLMPIFAPRLVEVTLQPLPITGMWDLNGFHEFVEREIAAACAIPAHMLRGTWR